jgi:hypothetical protein
MTLANMGENGALALRGVRIVPPRGRAKTDRQWQ